MKSSQYCLVLMTRAILFLMFVCSNNVIADDIKGASAKSSSQDSTAVNSSIENNVFSGDTIQKRAVQFTEAQQIYGRKLQKIQDRQHIELKKIRIEIIREKNNSLKETLEKTWNEKNREYEIKKNEITKLLQKLIIEYMQNEERLK